MGRRLVSASFFDDGGPLGSAASEECRIDSIAQSWATLSGAAAPERAKQAMSAVERELIRREDSLALLFAPPFDKSARDPGYIRAYPPGVRENGGQYTHAALWSVMAFAALGEGDKAVNCSRCINPINHARTRTDVLRYKVEPYVVAADVYATPPHVGRGGWTWYTGSAGWMQRAGVESILGLSIRGAFLILIPAFPKHGRNSRCGFAGIPRVTKSSSTIPTRSRGIRFAEIDGIEVSERPLRLRWVDDGAVHRVHVTLG